MGMGVDCTMLKLSLMLILVIVTAVSSFSFTAKRSAQVSAFMFPKGTSLSSMRPIDEMPIQIDETKIVISEASCGEKMNLNNKQFLNLAVMALALLFTPIRGAHANQYGILAGKTASLIREFVMAALFGLLLWLPWLQWRRLRGFQTKSKLQKQGPICPQAPQNSNYRLCFGKKSRHECRI